MSMPVFLNSCPANHMPDGSKDEWKDFYYPKNYELEAEAFIPLFWLLLYSQENIQFVRYIDDYDIHNQETKIDRQECLENFGNATYPYFIVSKENALKNLQERKQGFLHYFGTDFKKLYKYFEQIIIEEYQQYILIRTNGLALNKQSERDFKETLIHYENLNNTQAINDSSYWQDIEYQIKKHENPILLLIGENFNNDPDILIPIIKSLTFIPKPKAKAMPDFIYWIFAIINGLITVGVFIKTESILYGFISFIICSIIIIILTSKYEKIKYSNNNEMTK